MPAIQSTYNATMPIGRPGAIVDMRNRTVISRELQSATLAFAQPVFRGTGDHLCAAIGGSGGFLGMSVMDPTVRAQNLNQYVQNDTIAILLKGIMWVTTAASCTPGQPAYYDASGNITSVSSGNTAIPAATFETTAAAGGLAHLRLA